MDRGFEYFAKELSELNPLLCIVNDGKRLIRELKLLDKFHGKLSSDEIYLGRVSCIDVDEQYSYDLETNIICVADKYVQKKMAHCKKLNLIVLDRNIDINCIFNKMQDILLFRKKIAVMSMRLIDHLAQGEGLQALADLGLEILGNPIIILNLSDNTLICSSVQLDNPVWNEMETQRFLSLELALRHKASGIIEELNSHMSKTPVLLELKDKPNCIAVNVYSKKTPVAHLAMPDILKSLSETDMELMALLADAVSLEMQKTRPLQTNSRYACEQLIRKLLGGAQIPKQDLLERGLAAGLQMGGINYVLSIDLSGCNLSNSNLCSTISNINTMIKGATSQIYQDTIVVVINRSPKERLGYGEREHIRRFLGEHNLSGGLSQEFTYLGDIQKYYLQAVKADELGVKMNNKKALYNYSDYVLYHIVQLCSFQYDLKSFCHPLVFDLMYYDNQCSFSYSETLYVFLKNDRNALAAAEELGIHRNTLNYRINKITEDIEIEWNNGNQHFHIYLSLIILSYLKI